MYLQFAWRYFKSKKTTNAINIISWVSISAIAVGTAALLIILSVFNGFEGFIKDLYTSFYPDIKITATKGKTFEASQSIIKSIDEIEGIKVISYSLEDKVLLSYSGDQTIAVLKGIDKNYNSITKISDEVNYGMMDFSNSEMQAPLVLGLGLANKLGASEQSLLPVTAFAFRNSKGYNLNSLNSFSQKDFGVQGVFYLQDDIDNKYAFAPLELVQYLLGIEDQYSSIEIGLADGINANSIKKKIANIIANTDLKVETRYEQNKTLFMILSSERWAVYAVLSLMLFIASFNIVGCLAMLILEKEKDIAILRTMGSDKSFIKKIFLSTSVLIGMIGALIGCIIAFTFAVLQSKFGFIKLGGDNFLVEAYPVDMHASDFILVVATVVIISLISGFWPATKAAAKEIELRVR